MPRTALRPVEWEQAIDTALQQASSDNPEMAVSLRQRRPRDPIVIAARWAAQNKPEEACQKLHDSLKVAANDEQKRNLARDGGHVLRVFAQLHKRSDTARAAVAFLRDAASANLDHADLQNALARAYALLGELEASPASLREALDAYDTALRLNGRVQTPGAAAFQWRVTINKAIALWQLATLDVPSSRPGLLTEARVLVEHALDALPEEAGPTARLDRPRALETLGNILLNQDQIDGAIAYFEQAERAWGTVPDRARVQNGLGLSYERKYQKEAESGLLDKALDAFSRARGGINREDDPIEWSRTQRNYSEALIQKAHIATNQDAILSEAADGLEEAIEACPASLSPALHAQIAVSLGDAFGLQAIVKTDTNSLKKSVQYYYTALSQVGFIDEDAIIMRMNDIKGRFGISHLGYMDRDNDITAAMMQLLRERNVTLDQWNGIAAKIGEQLAGTVGASVAPSGTWAERIGEERASTAALRIPTTWEEAKAQVPGLMKWNEAKKLPGKGGQARTIIDHLRDPEMGYGRWTLQEPGLTRNKLKTIGDAPAYNALYAWLGKTNSETGKPNELPPDMHLPRLSDRLDLEVQAARENGNPRDMSEWFRIRSARQRRNQKNNRVTPDCH